jgi:hypothetical protein
VLDFGYPEPFEYCFVGEDICMKGNISADNAHQEKDRSNDSIVVLEHRHNNPYSDERRLFPVSI